MNLVIRKLIKQGYIKLIFSRGVSSFGSILLTFAITTYYGVDTLGLFSLVLSCIGLLAILSRVGLDTIIVKVASIYYANLERNRFVTFFGKIYLLVGLISLALTALYCFYYERLNYLLGIEANEALSVFILYFIPYTYLALHSSFFKAIKLPWLYPVFELGSASFVLAVVIFFVIYLGIQIDFVNIIHINGLILIGLSVIGILILCYKVKYHFIKNEKACISDPSSNFIKTIPDFFILTLAAYLANTGVPFLISSMVTKHELGVFMICFRISILVNLIITIINSVVAPNIAIYFSRGNEDKLKQEVIKANRTIMLSCLPILIFLFIFPEIAISIFNHQSELSNSVLRILILGQAINVATGLVASILNMTGKQKNNRNITIISSAICIILLFLLTPMFGILGTAISLSTYWFAKNISSAVIVAQAFKFNVVRVW